MASLRVSHCTYCCEPVAKPTADHCPPKQLFPEPLPNNLRTVDACESCNSEAKIDEDYFRGVLLVTEIANSEAGKRLWEGKAGRGFQKDKGLRAKINASMQWRDVTSEGGIALGRQMTLQVDHDRLERVAEKIARGLFRLECGALLPADTAALTRFMLSQKTYEIVEPQLPKLQWGRYRWPGIFDYRWGQGPGKPHMTMWVLRFYEMACFMVSTAPPDKMTEWMAEAASREQGRIYIPTGLASAQ